MTIDLLERVPVDVMGVAIDDGRELLAKKCKKLFGYTELYKVIENQTRDKDVNDFVAALAAKGIIPFSNRTVDNYKASELVRLNGSGRLPDTAIGRLAARLAPTPLGYMLGIPLKEKEWVWFCQEIHSYREPVPEFALETAVSVCDIAGATGCISGKPSDVSICIDSLVEVSTGSYGDPFLVAEFKNVKFYLEVWNEPNFHGHREA
jgi:hypothetical protein